MEYLSHGDGWQPPGRPGAALGSWEATRGGKSSRWYIFPMEAAGSRPAGPEQPWGAGWPPGEGRADGSTIFPMEEAGSRPAGPELSWGAGWPPGEGRAADGTSSPWRRPAAARPARSCPGKLVATRRTESRRMCYLPHEGGRQPPGWLGAAREI